MKSSFSHIKPYALAVSVLRHSDVGQGVDYTHGGCTSTHDRVILVPIGASVPTDTDVPVLQVVRRMLAGGDYLHAVPVQQVAGMHYCAGGNFVYTADSEYSAWIGPYPISVHDRTE